MKQSWRIIIRRVIIVATLLFMVFLLITLAQTFLNRKDWQIDEKTEAQFIALQEGSHSRESFSIDESRTSQTQLELGSSVNALTSEIKESIPKLKSAQAALLIDSQSGQILYQTGTIDDPIEVGNLTQLMTLYMAYQAVEQKKASLEDEIWISDSTYELSQDYDIPNVPLRQDLAYKLEDLIEAIAVGTANGANQAVAEHLAGSQSVFLQRMKDQLSAWGGQAFKLQDINGLSDQYDPNLAESNLQGHTNSMTALSLATIAYHLIHEYPQLLNYSQITKLVFQEGTSDAFDLNNPNQMVAKADSLFAQQAVDGLMATQTPDGLYHVVTTGSKDKDRYIAVVLGCKSPEDLYHDGNKLLEFGFNAFKSVDVIQANKPADQVDELTVKKGKVSKAKLVYGQGLRIITPQDGKRPTFKYTFQADPQLVQDKRLQAPLAAATQVGQLRVDLEGYRLEYLPTATTNSVPVKLQDEIKLATRSQQFVQAWFDNMKNWQKRTRRFFIEVFN